MTPGNNETLVTLLRDILEQFDCTSGTLHRAEEGGLKLVAHDGIPESVLDKIETIPIGKGRAGREMGFISFDCGTDICCLNKISQCDIR